MDEQVLRLKLQTLPSDERLEALEALRKRVRELKVTDKETRAETFVNGVLSDPATTDVTESDIRTAGRWVASQ